MSDIVIRCVSRSVMDSPVRVQRISWMQYKKSSLHSRRHLICSLL